jgi:hypothetical protein
MAGPPMSMFSTHVAKSAPLVGLALFTALLLCVKTPVDDGQYGPYNQSGDTRE